MENDITTTQIINYIFYFMAITDEPTYKGKENFEMMIYI
jgi:hypothetical protein